MEHGHGKQEAMVQKLCLKKYDLKLYVVQNHYSLLYKERQGKVLDYCEANGILFFGYIVLEQGALISR